MGPRILCFFLSSILIGTIRGFDIIPNCMQCRDSRDDFAWYHAIGLIGSFRYIDGSICCDTYKITMDAHTFTLIEVEKRPELPEDADYSSLVVPPLMIMNIWEDAFQDSSLEDLTFMSLYMLTLREGNFAGLPNLKELSLLNGRIRLCKNAFTGLTNLKVLRIQSAGINWIARETFSGLSGLEHLRMSRNRLNMISKEFFEKLNPKLRLLDFSHNNISVIDSEAFFWLPGLQIINLRNNRFTEFISKPFRILSNLDTINLDNNQLSKLTRDTFRGLGSLKRLLLGDNRITTIDDFAFQELDQLVYLNLEGNQLTQIHSDTFKGLFSLQQLILSRNKLVKIHVHAFTDLNNLAHLLIEKNNITEIDIRGTKLPNTTRVRFHDEGLHNHGTWCRSKFCD